MTCSIMSPARTSKSRRIVSTFLARSSRRCCAASCSGFLVLDHVLLEDLNRGGHFADLVFTVEARQRSNCHGKAGPSAIRAPVWQCHRRVRPITMIANNVPPPPKMTNSSSASSILRSAAATSCSYFAAIASNASASLMMTFGSASQYPSGVRFQFHPDERLRTFPGTWFVSPSSS